MKNSLQMLDGPEGLTPLNRPVPGWLSLCGQELWVVFGQRDGRFRLMWQDNARTLADRCWILRPFLPPLQLLTLLSLSPVSSSSSCWLSLSLLLLLGLLRWWLFECACPSHRCSSFALAIRINATIISFMIVVREKFPSFSISGHWVYCSLSVLGCHFIAVIFKISVKGTEGRRVVGWNLRFYAKVKDFLRVYQMRNYLKCFFESFLVLVPPLYFVFWAQNPTTQKSLGDFKDFFSRNN